MVSSTALAQGAWSISRTSVEQNYPDPTTRNEVFSFTGPPGNYTGMLVNYFCNSDSASPDDLRGPSTSFPVPNSGLAQVTITWTRPYAPGPSPRAVSGDCRFRFPFTAGGQEFTVVFRGATQSQYQVSFNGQALNATNELIDGTERTGAIALHDFTVTPPRQLFGVAIGWSCALEYGGIAATRVTFADLVSSPGTPPAPTIATMRLVDGETPYTVTLARCGFTPVGGGGTGALYLRARDPCTPAVTPALAKCNNIGTTPRLTVLVRNRNGQAGASGSVAVSGGLAGTCAGPGTCTYVGSPGATVPVSVLPTPAAGWKVASYSGDCVPGGVDFGGNQANNLLAPQCHPPTPFVLDDVRTCVVTFDRLAAGETPGC